MPGKNDLGDFIGDVHIEVHKKGIKVLSREAGREAFNKEDITLQRLESFIANWKK